MISEVDKNLKVVSWPMIRTYIKENDSSFLDVHIIVAQYKDRDNKLQLYMLKEVGVKEYSLVAIRDVSSRWCDIKNPEEIVYKLGDAKRVWVLDTVKDLAELISRDF